MADDNYDPDRLLTEPAPASATMRIAPQTPDAAPAISPAMRGVLDSVIAPGESSGSYNVIYGGRTVDDFSHHPNIKTLITSGPNAGKYSTAAGKYQFLNSTWQNAANALGLTDFSPESQDRAAAWLAQKTYRDQTGRDLESDYASGDPRLQAGIRHALAGEWESLGKPGPRVDKLWTLGNDRFKFDDNAMTAHQGQPDTDLVYMRPDDYLTLSPSLDDDPSHSVTGGQALRASIAKGEPVRNLPTLNLSMKDDIANVTGQDGRWRALLGKTAGLDAIPVAMKRDGPGSPTEIMGMQGQSVPSQAYAPVDRFTVEKGDGGSMLGRFLGIGSAQAAEPTGGKPVDHDPFAESATGAAVDQDPFAASGQGKPVEHDPFSGASSKPTDDWAKQHPIATAAQKLPLPEPMKTVAGLQGLGADYLVEGVRSLGRGVSGLSERLPGHAAPGAASIGETDNPTPKPMRGLDPDELGLVALGAGLAPGSKAAAAVAAKAYPSFLDNWLKGIHGEEAVNNKAAQQLLARITSDQRGGGPTLQNMLDVINETPDKPLTLADVGGANLKSLLGRIARTPGDAKAIINQWLNARDLDAGTRVSTDVMGTLGAESRVYTDEALKAARSIQAKPLFEKAYEGGSLAPLKDQFEAANARAGKAIADAEREVAHAENRITEALRREQQAGDNVYGVNGAREDRRAAEAQRAFAQKELDTARSEKEMILDRLHQAQDDIATNKPGAVWSPRIQQFLDNPRVRSGIRRGLVIERDEALAEGRAMNPTDYAIVGEENGEPIIGKVPTMRLLAVGKEGLDRMLQSTGMRNQFGELNKEGVAVDKIRREFLRELDRINPDYAAAREQWGGDTQSMLALKAGQNIFKMDPEAIQSLVHGSSPDAIRSALAGKVPEEVIEQAVERATKGMASGDKEFFRLGAANEMRKMIEATGEKGDETRRLIATERGRRQLRAMFDTEQEFEKFFKSLNAEHKMFDTWASVFGNSKTAERVAEDSSTKSGLGHLASGAYHTVRGNVLGAVHGIGRGIEKLWPGLDPQVAAEQARILSVPGEEGIGRLQAVKPPPGRVGPSPLRLANPGFVPQSPSQGATQGMPPP